MAQKNRKVVKDVPGTVKEFSSITFKKFKKENKDYCTYGGGVVRIISIFHIILLITKI